MSRGRDMCHACRSGLSHAPRESRVDYLRALFASSLVLVPHHKVWTRAIVGFKDALCDPRGFCLDFAALHTLLREFYHIHCK